MTSMLRHLSIKTRVLLVSAVLIAILAGMTFYTTAKLAANSRAVAETAGSAALSQLANQTRTASARIATGSLIWLSVCCGFRN